MIGRLKHLRRDGGAIAAMVSVMLATGGLLGVSALVIDVGHLYVEREELQTGADAAAHGVAKACALGGCATTSAVTGQWVRARRLADTNSSDGRTEVTSICGRWAAIPTCGAAATDLTRCIGTPPSGELYVQVQVRTRLQNGSSLLPPTFAPALAGSGYQGTTVAACARVSGFPSTGGSGGAGGLWALGTTANALSIPGGSVTVNGLAYSNGGIHIGGNDAKTNGAQYVTTLVIIGSLISVPSPVRVSTQPAPATVNVADYRPGGIKATGSNYHAIPASSCVSGVWNTVVALVPTGIVYVPCGIRLNSSGTVNALIVAEGVITMPYANTKVIPPTPGPGLVTASNAATAISMTGAQMQISGGLEAVNGGVVLSGAQSCYPRGVIARTITVSGGGELIGGGGTCGGPPTYTTRLTG